jgi:alkaline phosphatase
MVRGVRFWVVAAAVVIFCARGGAGEVPAVKYVFLFIGDGMALPQQRVAEEFLRRREQRGLFMNSLPKVAVTTTYSASSVVTDSAAAATAFACGVKTNNGWLGLTPDGAAVESIAVTAKKNGRRVGLISSVTLNHATPAGFYAHQQSRGSSEAIAREALVAEFDYYGGGGWQQAGDFFKLATNAGYTVLRPTRREELLASEVAPSGATSRERKLIVCGANGYLPYALDRAADALSLADFTAHAIACLTNPAGFFLMVEGGRIDSACHRNDGAAAVGETLDFDAAIQVAEEFRQRHPAETLIVVSADHETGGMTLGREATGYAAYFELLAKQTASLEGLAEKLRQYKGERLPVWEDAQKLLAQLSGLEFGEGHYQRGSTQLSGAEKKEVEELWQQKVAEKSGANGNLAQALVRILNQKAGLGWTTHAHTALPVVTGAIGVGSEFCVGFIDNTEIANALRARLAPLTE